MLGQYLTTIKRNEQAVQGFPINRFYTKAESDARFAPIGVGGYVPTSRTLTINGTTYDLSADRSWTIAGGVTSTSNSDGTLTISPTTGAVVASLNLTHANTWTGIQTLSPTARSSGSASYFTVNAPADTGITTATESIGINHVGATRTWVDGTVATQREYFFGAPTYNKTTTSATFTNTGTLVIAGAPNAGTGVTLTHPWALWIQSGVSHFGSQIGYTQAAVGGTGAEFNDSNNTTGGQIITVQNTNNGTSAYSGFNLNNDQGVDGASTSHFFGMFFNSSTYTDTTFGTANAIASLGVLENTDGPISLISSATSQYINFVVGGSSTTNEIARMTTTGVSIGKTANTAMLDVLGATQTGSNQVGTVNLAQTWNTSGTPTAILLNVTDTASNSGSFLLDLQKGGTSQFSVNKVGTVITKSSITINGNFATNGGVNSNFQVQGSGSGVTASASAANRVTANNIDFRSSFGGGGASLFVNNDYGAVITSATPITTALSGAHTWLIQQVIQPLGTVTVAGTATITNTATVFINGVSNAGTNNYAIYIASGNCLFNGSLNLAGGLYSSINTNGNFNVLNATNGATQVAGGFQIGGASSSQMRTIFNGVSTFALTANQSVTNVLFASAGGGVTASTGTTAVISNVYIKPVTAPTISGSATVTNTASLYIEGASSGATNNYALQVASGTSIFGGLVILKNYTVGTLPTGIRGAIAYCTDLLLPTFMAVATGGGAVVGKVFYDGTNWITQ